MYFANVPHESVMKIKAKNGKVFVSCKSKHFNVLNSQAYEALS